MTAGRVRLDGKQFALGDRRFPFRGVTYGTFESRPGDGAMFPDRSRLKLDLGAIRDAGLTVVRTYTPPPDDLVELAADSGLKVMAGAFFPDWRYLVGSSRRQQRAMAQQARRAVRSTAARLSGSDPVMALVLANEVPSDVVRWVGTGTVSALLGELVEEAKAQDPDLLVTYANYPTTEYLACDSLDFVTFNVFLEQRDQFRRYLTRLHHLAGDRPLVLGEVGLDSGGTPEGEGTQAQMLDWALATAVERGVAGTCIFSWTDEWAVADVPVEGWHFGLTRRDRSPKPALDVAQAWAEKTVADLPGVTWPSMSVVVCAYNAADTLDECLRHASALDYPDLELLVVDDGSTDATAEIVRRHPRAQLISVPHGGLSAARNEGYRRAWGEIVAYLDADAYPSPEWPYYLALAFDEPSVGGAGGPNLPPPEDGRGASQVAQSPGGPVHVLLTDDRAEHVPGCNMAFRRQVLAEVGGFDPIYTSAGDDVDFCWRVLDSGLQIGFHPAALVWHHRRSGLRTYLRQQRGYGRAEALVAPRHPDRFTGSGTASWKGRIYNHAARPAGRRVIYRGLYGSAPFQSLYRAGGHGLDLAHQVGVPAALALVATFPLGLVAPWLVIPAAAAVVFLLGLGAVDAIRARPPGQRRWRFRLGVAAMHLLQPLARALGRLERRRLAEGTALAPLEPLPGPVTKAPGGVLVMPLDRPREQLTAALVAALRRSGMRLRPATAWENHDGLAYGSSLLVGRVVTSGHPVGCVQVRMVRRPRWARLSVALAAAAVIAAAGWIEGAVAVTALVVVETARGWHRTGGRLRSIIAAATRQETEAHDGPTA